MTSSTVTIRQMLESMADGFRDKIDSDYSLTVLFVVTDQDESWSVTIRPGRRVDLQQGDHTEAAYVFSADMATFAKIAAGEMTALTAASRARMSDPAPLEVDLAAGLDFVAERRRLYEFLQRFFNVSEPERIALGERHARLVHGGHAIPLYYDAGMRSAWYMLKAGEQLNEVGDTNPFSQAFIFVEGEGFATIGAETVRVRAGESYYIPPGSDHVVWTDGPAPLVLIFLAWGPGA